MARGGMGEVFRATALGPDGAELPVVIKRIVPMHAGSSDLTERFVAETAEMSRLTHPNLVEVFDFGLGEDGDFYVVLELVIGTDLGRLCRWLWARGESVPVPVSLFVTSEVLRGLSHAHERSAARGRLLVHRDVSPGNVLLSSAGAVKVVDFGVALATRSEADDATRRDLVGKPSYMPPEQFDGEEVDARADVFAVAVVLFQMLTRSHPFPGTSAAARMAAVREGQMLRASELRAEVNAALEAVLAQALAPRREDRFPDARAMLEAIEALRDAGHEIGGPEDLARLVTAAMKELPEVRTGTTRPPPALPDDGDLEGCELTRVGTAAPFTLRVTGRRDAPEELLSGDDEGEIDGARHDRLDALPPAPSTRPGPSSAPASSGFHAVRPALTEDDPPDLRLEPDAAAGAIEPVATARVPGDSGRPLAGPGSLRSSAPAAGGRQRLLATAIGLAALAGISLAGVQAGQLRAGSVTAAAARVSPVTRPVIDGATLPAFTRSHAHWPRAAAAAPSHNAAAPSHNAAVTPPSAAAPSHNAAAPSHNAAAPSQNTAAPSHNAAATPPSAAPLSPGAATALPGKPR